VLEFTQDELTTGLQQTARAFLTRRWDGDTVREHRSGDDAALDELWPVIANDLGWLGLIVGEEHDGSGASFGTLAALAEELGRGLFPTTFYSTVIGAELIGRCGTESQRVDLLPPVVTGALRLTVAAEHLGRPFDSGWEGPTATRDGDDWVLDGVVPFVPDADRSDVIVVVARLGGALGCLLVERQTAGVEVRPLRTTGRNRLTRLSLTGVRVPPAAVLGGEGDRAAELEATRAWTLALDVADLIGVGTAVLEKTLSHLRERLVFGVPIGSFQAVQHRCADLGIELDGATLLARRACWLLDQDRPAAVELAAAHAFVSEVVTDLTLVSHQLHGGIGFSLEDVLHMYSARAKATELIHGTPDQHYESVAAARVH